jgi:hypothetical protein
VAVSAGPLAELAAAEASLAGLHRRLGELLNGHIPPVRSNGRRDGWSPSL